MYNLTNGQKGESIMTQAKKKANVVTASKIVAKPVVVNPAGNSGIPAPSKHGFDGRKIKLISMDLPNNQKIAPQAMIILKTLDALGGEATQKQIVEGLVEIWLKKVQTPKRIYDFYRKDLLERKLIDYV